MRKTFEWLRFRFRKAPKQLLCWVLGHEDRFFYSNWDQGLVVYSQRLQVCTRCDAMLDVRVKPLDTDTYINPE